MNCSNRINKTFAYSEWSSLEARALQCRLVYPPLVIGGLLCNLLALFTFQQSRLRRSPISLCLSTLAVLDSIVLICSATRYWLKFQANFDWQVQNIYLCKASLFLEYQMADFSVYTLLLVTAQRYVGTHFPLRAGKLCRRSRTCVFLVALGILCSVKNLPLLIRAKIDCLPMAGPVCQIVHEPQLWMVFSWIDSSFRFLIPFPSLLFLNMSICRKVRAARKFRRNHLGESRSSIHGHSTTAFNNNNNTSNICKTGPARQPLSRSTSNPLTQLRTTKELLRVDSRRRISQASVRQTNLDDGRRMLMMLVVVNFVFVACQTPWCIFCILDSAMGLMKRAFLTRNEESYRLLSFWFQTCLTSVYVSHATNFFFYCLSGRLFRNSLVRMLGLKRRRQ